MKKNDPNIDKIQEYEKAYSELLQKAQEIYPGLQETISSANTTLEAIREYDNYVKLTQIQPYSVASTKTTL